MKRYSFFVFFALLFLASCGQDLTGLGSGNSGRGSSNNNSALMCSCNDQPNYVCGTNGTMEMTFLNGCIAQCNGFSYRTGACDANRPIADCDPQIKDVCGQPACADSTNCPSPGFYADQCVLVNAGATQVDNSECSN